MSHHICSVIGARPQFVKSCALSRALAQCKDIQEFQVHTGQHYDREMSEVFFEEFGLKEPEYNLQVGSAAHGAQTAMVLERFEKVLLERSPELVIVFGDTNSTLGGALAAVKLNIPVAHVEAGLRCGDMSMPEEINRVLTDRISKLLFCPTQSAVESLKNEGISAGVHLLGDVMVDTFEMFRKVAEKRTDVLHAHGLTSGKYVLMTVHRAENTASPKNLISIFDACGKYGETVFFPVHPRTAKFIEEHNIKPPKNVVISPPVSYLDIISLQLNARVVMTDSGGIQKESFLAGVPCITLRKKTEWVETVDAGWNILAGADAVKIASVLEDFHPTAARQDIFGPRNASARIAGIIEKFLKMR